MTRFDPPTMEIVRHFSANGKEEEDCWQGEIEMTDELKDIIGDGRAKVTISRDIAEKSFGRGGSLFVSVTLSVDQSHENVAKGIELAKHYAEETIEAQFGPYLEKLIKLLPEKS